MQTAAQEPMLLHSLVVPLQDNEGRPFQDELDWVWETLAHFAGGYTAFPAGTGCWVDSAGVLSREPIVVVHVVTPASREAGAFFSELARELAMRLRQQEVFLFALPVARVTSPERAVSALAAD